MSRGSLGHPVAIVALALAGAASGCRKPAETRKDPDNRVVAAQVVAPRRSTDAAAVAPAAQTFDVDEKTGRPKVVLVLRLDHFPDPKPGVTNLPVCYAPFAGDFDVGIATCDGDLERKVPVLAKHLDQDCYTDPAVERIPASEPLVLIGCRRGGLAVHPFEPRLKVDMEGVTDGG